MNALVWILPITFAGAAACLLVGRRSAAAARWTALATAVAGFACALVAGVVFEPGPEAITLVDRAWIPEIGARLHLAVDGVGLTLVVLTGLAATAGVLFSWNIERRTGEFFSLYLALIGGVHGVFLSADALLLFVFYEIAIVPKYFLIAIWGSTNREHGALKLVLYSFAGSVLVLAGLLWAYAAGGANGFGLDELAAATREPGQAVAMFALVFTGFAVLAGMFPLHTWAPTGHVAAPTGASMLLAGVVMKLGAYGCLRVAMPLFPEGYSFFQDTIAVLALIGIVYAGLIALVQEDLKFVVGYSSVSHMGFVLLGLAAGNAQAISGAVLQMFSHGVVAGLLFAVAGRMVYDRVHTRELGALRTMGLHRRMPFVAGVFVIGGLASMGLPLFSGFPAELMILLGAWKTSPAWVLVAAGGIVVAGAFTLRAVQGAFFAQRGGAAPAGGEGDHALEPITWPEKVGAGMLIATTVLVGVQPGLLLRWIEPVVQSGWLRVITTGGAP
ncbi:NADH-quinone oxidoreductase subunit M [Opitutales bacterium ASA1]|uniref:complex I subunit 4 family protein n=1 Tax=Congregicoccus parvus TaxID=3081749 RepID=UPI002B2AA1C9|nr:NADH-quinone oxidoreductase subunit M [Opitutales bacterium ASA1]